MARPSSFDRDAAVRTAMEELWRNGYEASSVKAISEKIGITRSSYYNAFGSREDLFKTALAVYFEQSPDRVLLDDPLAVPIKVLLTDFFREVCAVRAGDAEGRGCLAVNCLTELIGSHSELGPFMADMVMRKVVRLEELLEIAVRNGELPEGTDIRAKALALQNLMIGLNAFSKALRREEELWLTARTTLEALDLYQEAADA